MSLTWVFGVVVLCGLLIWLTGKLLKSKPGARDFIQAALIIAAFLLIVLQFLSTVQNQGMRG